MPTAFEKVDQEIVLTEKLLKIVSWKSIIVARLLFLLFSVVAVTMIPKFDPIGGLFWGRIYIILSLLSLILFSLIRGNKRKECIHIHLTALNSFQNQITHVFEEMQKLQAQITKDEVLLEAFDPESPPSIPIDQSCEWKGIPIIREPTRVEIVPDDIISHLKGCKKHLASQQETIPRLWRQLSKPPTKIQAALDRLRLKEQKQNSSS